MTCAYFRRFVDSTRRADEVDLDYTQEEERVPCFDDVWLQESNE